MSPRGKHVPESPASFYASVGRHAAGAVAVVGVVALVIALATRDDDGSAIGVQPTTSTTNTGQPTGDPSATTSAAPTDTTTPAREPRPRVDIRVTVLNGEGTPQLASRTSDRFIQAGYTVANVGDAAPRDKTVIFYKKGAKPEALLLLEDFPELIRVKPAAGDEIDADALLTVILGDDYEA
jgi:hypothetical protein